MSRIVVFSGPTLSSDEIHEIVPQAEVYPPVAAGELLRLPLQPGDLVAIIDGYYFQAASVRHKEILDLLARGIHVWGAGSMGALRAAELAPFGMRGFGHVFHAYIQGDIDGDDEVALIHAPEEMGYLKLSEALVNIRYACTMAIQEEIISENMSHAIREVACGLPFFERVYPHMCKVAQERGLDASECERFLACVRQSRLDVKRNDALEMLHALRDAPTMPFQPAFYLNQTHLLRSWRQDEQGIHVKDQWIPYRELLTAYQLFGEDYPIVHYRTLVAELARLVKEDQMEVALSDEQIVSCFLMQQYGFREELGVPEVARRWLRPDEWNLPYEQQMALLAVRLWHVQQGPSWQACMIRFVCAHPLCTTLLKIVYQARHYHCQLEKQQQGLYMDYLVPAKMEAWFRERWHIDERTFPCALLDRGFASPADFLQAARSFYLFDKYIGVAPLRVEEAIPA